MQKRNRLFIDIDVQVALMWRVGLYWGTFGVAVLLMQFCWVALTAHPVSSLDLLQRALSACGPAIIASALLIPLVLVDCLRLSNRFVGPVYRLRKAMRELSQGIRAEPVVLRRDDFWRDLTEDINRMIEKQNTAESGTRSEEASLSA
jgi:hypothetical protein